MYFLVPYYSRLRPKLQEFGQIFREIVLGYVHEPLILCTSRFNLFIE